MKRISLTILALVSLSLTSLPVRAQPEPQEKLRQSLVEKEKKITESQVALETTTDKTKRRALYRTLIDSLSMGGLLAQELEDWKRELAYYQTAYNRLIEARNEFGSEADYPLAESLAGMAQAHFALRDFESAAVNARRGISEAKRDTVLSAYLPGLYQLQAQIQLAREQYGDATKSLEAELHLLSGERTKGARANAIRLLGTAMYLQGNLTEARVR